MSQSEETALGLEAADKVLRTERPSRDAARIAQVRRVGGAIAAVSGMAGARWEFYVIEKKEPNAFCLPGGIVFVNSGLFPYVKNDDQLAAVIGHEVAHALAHHGAERVSQRMAVALPGVAVATVLGSESPALGQAFASVYGIGANVGYVLPHSRQQESEADRIGLILMAKAGYDPDAAVGFWNNMRAAKGSKPPEFLSTHPADDSRIQNIIRFLPEARSYIPASVPPPPDDDPPPGVDG
ncbi:M48 family metallopeptidase [Fundidesulfovibrio soli]|uniref:M48 family metallopeptidase n=1 Tax=Fundidesulfovibrio soli TaxID=2922716 RepID=UPI001FB008EF|nr:M48 family metallopeptidase [Fundidesulfovibrio soli]